MPPPLALLLSFALSTWLIKRDGIQRPALTLAHFVVLLWLMIRASRPITSWFGGIGSGGSDVDGNAAEAAIMLLFFVVSIAILARRNFNFGSLPALNIFLFILILYLGISCLWSYMPFVSFKRWFKEFGALFVALLIVTDRHPAETIRAICVRSAYILFPLSIVLIKYFPHLGRAYSISGQPMVTGVTDQKNALGLICCIFCLALIWDLYEARTKFRLRVTSKSLRPQVIAFLLGIWLLWDSQSKTSLVALLVGILIFFATHIPVVRRAPRTFALTTIILIGTALALVGTSTMIAAPLLQAVGRDATLTGRTEIWQAALDQPTNPLIGSGFYIFWNEYGPTVWSYFQGNFFVRSVHSGYIEMYLDGGLIGCALLGTYLATLSLRVSNQYSHSSPTSRIFLSYVAIFIVTNFSESYLLRLGDLWFIIVTISLIRMPAASYNHNASLARSALSH